MAQVPAVLGMCAQGAQSVHDLHRPHRLRVAKMVRVHTSSVKRDPLGARQGDGGGRQERLRAHLEALALLLLRVQRVRGEAQELEQSGQPPQCRHCIDEHQRAAWVSAATDKRNRGRAWG